MKKICLILCICVSLLVFVSASIWEGAATTGGALPETGLYIATNSFPLNTVVEVTNLENGETTRLIVYSRLDTAGYLALLSKDAAAILDIPDSTVCRIRMNQVSDLLALSRFTEDRVLSGDHDSLDLALVPAEDRPPSEMIELDPSAFVDPLRQTSGSAFIDPSLVIAPVPSTTAPRSLSSVPTVRSLDRGKYYVQLAAYSNTQSVNAEISKIDNRLPVVIMDAGTQGKPLYRVLLGPLNLGEAGALLQRFKSTYRDAFVRSGG